MSRAITGLMLVISALFVAGGIAMVATRAEGGWPALLFFGMCAVVFVGQLWPGLMRRPDMSPDVMLASFPGPVELRMDQRKILLMIVGGLIFGGVLLWMLLSEPVGTWRAILLWPGVGLIGLSIPILIFLLLRGGTLRLTGEHLEVRHGWSARTMPWAEIGNFEVRHIPPSFTPLVAYDDVAAAGARMAGANVALTGHTSSLPDNYGMAHEDLAAVLNAWRAGATHDSR